MKIGLLLPSLLMAKRFSDRIFAPKPLFLTLANGLVKKGHKVFVYSAPETPTRSKLISGDKQLAEKDFPSVRFRAGQDGYLNYKLTYNEYEVDLTEKAYLHGEKEKLEIMHSYHDNMSHYFAKLSAITTVYTLHDPVFCPNSIEVWRFKRFAKDNYIAISKRQAEICRGAGLNIVDVVYHGIDINSLSFSPSSKDYLAFIGRFIPEKGVLDAIKVSEMLQIPLHLATSDNDLETTYYKETLKERLNNKLTSLMGYMNENTLCEWLKHAKALLFPIQWEEPFGMVMIEAMACGVPVIAYNRGSVSEIVRDGLTGFIVDPPEADLQVQSSSRFNRDKVQNEGQWIIKKKGIEGLIEAVKRIGEIDRRACRKHVEENFTIEKMVTNYENVYREVIKAK